MSKGFMHIFTKLGGPSDATERAEHLGTGVTPPRVVRKLYLRQEITTGFTAGSSVVIDRFI